jgi:hypothetical protein
VSLPATGFGWVSGAGLRVGVQVGEDLFLTSEDFESRGVQLLSPYHTSGAQSFRWEWKGRTFTLTFCLVGRDAIGCRAEVARAETPAGAGSGPVSEPVHLLVIGTFPRRPRSWDGTRGFSDSDGTLRLYADPGPWAAVASSLPVAEHGFWTDAFTHEALRDALAAGEQPKGVSRASQATQLLGVLRCPLPAADVQAWVALGRGDTADQASDAARRALGEAEQALAHAKEADERFWSKAPRLSGDWPDSWRRSWVYDLESTRMMVQPPAGIFRGPWPTWMAGHQRVVVAEGTLDMFRHGWADLEEARQAVLTLFRDAPEDQVPCCWANGGYNMVAGDGSACGTSPAWCLPFHNVWCLHLMAPSPEWLSQLYQPMVRYLRWWLRNRVDEDGWAVYKCTWESGEDCTPRLDPEETGFKDLTRTARPGELQAAMAMSARVLSLIGAAIGRPAEELEEWETTFRHFQERTHRLFDPKKGHFRDRFPVTGAFVEAKGDYWGATDVTHDALHLIPLLYGIATPEQQEAVEQHLAAFNALPWCIWPSWTYVVTEACRAVGRHSEAGRMSADVLSRVYPENDRRSLSPYPHPHPGVTREYWPLSLEGYDASSLYGWGATTSLLLLRHLVGFSESEETEGVRFRLAPWLPEEWRLPGRAYRLTNLHYRRCQFDLELRPLDGERVEMALTLVGASRLEVRGSGQDAVPVSDDGHGAFRFTARFGVGYAAAVS